MSLLMPHRVKRQHVSTKKKSHFRTKNGINWLVIYSHLNAAFLSEIVIEQWGQTEIQTQKGQTHTQDCAYRH